MACPSCSPTEFIASRRDTWQIAHRLLKDYEWEESIGPADVLLLAMFLEGVVVD